MRLEHARAYNVHFICGGVGGPNQLRTQFPDNNRPDLPVRY